VHQIFIDLKKAYDSIRRDVLYNILIEFGIPMKLVRHVKMCLNETYSTVRVGKHLSDTFPIKNGLKQGDALSPLFFNFVLEYAIRSVQANQEDLNLNGIHQRLFYADDVNVLGRSVHALKENTQALLVANKEIGLEVNAEKTEYMVMSRDQNARQNRNIKVDNKSFERVEQFKYIGTTRIKQNSIQEAIKTRLKLGNTCYHFVQDFLSSSLLSKNTKIKIHRFIILPDVLYGCETWSLTLREEHRLTVFENRVLQRIFGPKRDGVTGEWRRLHNEGLNDLYSSPNIIRVIKSGRMRWAGHVARMVEGRGAYRILVGRPEEMRPLGRPRCRWEDNIKMNLQKVGWGTWTGLIWLWIGTGGGLL
jgi:hypothetical protein